MNELIAWVQRTFVWFTQFRYVKFGIVGASGTVVNLVVLTFAQEILFKAIEPARNRLYASLACAILVATINNFTWNRLWTWADRKRANAVLATPVRINYVQQFGQYALASWLGMAVQYALTLWLSGPVGWHYLAANLTAIAIASVSNFFANDWWTFRAKKK
jgi:putative flippase GtrA